MVRSTTPHMALSWWRPPTIQYQVTFVANVFLHSYSIAKSRSLKDIDTSNLWQSKVLSLSLFFIFNVFRWQQLIHSLHPSLPVWHKFSNFYVPLLTATCFSIIFTAVSMNNSLLFSHKYKQLSVSQLTHSNLVFQSVPYVNHSSLTIVFLLSKPCKCLSFFLSLSFFSVS